MTRRAGKIHQQIDINVELSARGTTGKPHPIPERLPICPIFPWKGKMGTMRKIGTIAPPASKKLIGDKSNAAGDEKARAPIDDEIPPATTNDRRDSLEQARRATTKKRRREKNRPIDNKIPATMRHDPYQRRRSKKPGARRGQKLLVQKRPRTARGSETLGCAPGWFILEKTKTPS